MNIDLLYINANFNFKNLKNPITYIPDSTLYQELVPGIKKQFQIELKKQTALLKDDVFGQKSTTRYFYEVKNINNDVYRFNKTEGTMIQYDFVAS